MILDVLILATSFGTLGLVLGSWKLFSDIRGRMELKTEELTKSLAEIAKVHNQLTMQFQDIEMKVSAHDGVLRGRKA